MEIQHRNYENFEHFTRIALFTLDINVWILALLKARNIHLSSDLEIFSTA